MGESTLDERRACQIPNNRTILTVTGNLAEGQAHGRCLFCSNLISSDCHLPETRGHKAPDSYELLCLALAAQLDLCRKFVPYLKSDPGQHGVEHRLSKWPRLSDLGQRF